MRLSSQAPRSVESLLIVCGGGKGRTGTRGRIANEALRKKEDSKKTVLLFGHQRELALYRAEVLAYKGFRVLIPRNHDEAVTAVMDGGFQVAVLSYTLPSTIVKDMAELIRQQCPECPLLMIAQNASDDPHVQPDEIVAADLGPSALVNAIERTLKRRIQ